MATTAPTPPATEPGAANLTAVLSPAAVPARGAQRSRLVVSSFGRFAIATHSRTGARLEVVDRMAGSLGVAGEAGSSDGRLDLFLDRGEYLLLIESPEPTAKRPPARGAAPVGEPSVAIDVQAAIEINGDPGPLLVEWKPLSTTLGDHQQRSYWLQIPRRRTVVLEAAGRHLSDLRLWRDGSWLEDATPACAVRQPVAGQPLRVCRLEPRLEAGLYRLAAYGDAGQPWSAGSDDRPLHVRWGIPTLPESGRQRFTMGPFGTEIFQAPAAANLFRLELPAAGEAQLRVGPIADGLPQWDAASAAGALVKETRPPAIEVDADAATDNEANVESDGETGGDYEESYDESEAYPEDANSDADADAEYADESDESDATDDQAMTEDSSAALEPSPPMRYVEVRAAPGQVFVLQQFERRDQYQFERSGRYWLSTIHTGQPGDSIDATAVLTAITPIDGQARPRVAAAAAVPLSAEVPWARRFNLLAPATVFFDVAAAGRYQVVAHGTGARFRLEPFLTSVPANYKTPPWRRSGDTWDLSAGLHVLTIDPESQGILEVGVRPAGRFERLLDLVDPAVATTAPTAATGASAAGTASPDRAPRGAANFGATALTAGTQYTLHGSLQPGVSGGVVLRELPLDLRHALPLALRPGEEAVVEFATDEIGTLVAETETGGRLPLALDGGAGALTLEAAAGSHQVRVVNPGATTATAALRFEPAALAAGTPQPQLPAAALEALPAFPEIVPASAQAADAAAAAHLELPRGASQTFLVRPPQPGLYVLQSSGLLATSGNLRTRTVTSLARGTQNGVGRNFLLQEYLGTGTYQLTVATLGRSAGHLGVEAHSTSLRDGGALRPGVAARATLQAGEGMLYAVEIPEAGEYRLRAAGAGYLFASRLEDREGWPIAPPDVDADLTREFAAGSYRFLLLPREVESRVLVTLERTTVGRRGEGHGPIALRLGVPHHHLWREPVVLESPATAGVPPADPARAPDRYAFELPAPARVTLTLDGEMQARLTSPAAPARPIIAIPPGRPWSQELPAGEYALEVECSRRNNLVPYSVTVATAELVAGTTQEIAVPGSIEVSTGSEGLVEITSRAPFPVRATLYAVEPELGTARSDPEPEELEGGRAGQAQRAVARSQGQPDDWNFLLAERLPAGRYRLAVEPLSDDSATVPITMRSLREVVAPAATLPFRRELQTGDDVHLVPLAWPRDTDLLVVRVRAAENVGCAIESAAGGAWREIEKQTGRDHELLVALDSKRPADLRLRLWSLDRRGLPLRLDVSASRLAHLREKQLHAGAALPPVPGAAGLRAAVVDLERPGSFQLETQLRWATSPLQSLESPSGLASSMGATPASRLWVASGIANGIANGIASALAGGGAGGAATRARAPRVRLGAMSSSQKLLVPATGLASVDLEVPAVAPRTASTASTASIARLLLADSRTGQPGVAWRGQELAGRGDRPATEVLGPMAVSGAVAGGRDPADAGGAAAAVILGEGATQAVVWNAAASDAVEIDLRQQRFSAEVRPIPLGIAEGTVPAAGAVHLGLPAASKRLRLALGARLVGAVVAGGEVRSVQWHGGPAFEETLDTTATELWILNTGATAAAYRVDLQSAPPAQPLEVSSHRPFEGRFDGAATARLALLLPSPPSASAPAPGWSVHARGTDATLTLVQEDGRVLRGRDLPVAVPGALLLHHGAGPALVWIDTPGARGPVWDTTATTQEIGGAATVALAGDSARLRLHGAAAFHLEAATPSVTVVRRGAAPAEVLVHAAETRLDVLAGGGDAEVTLHGLSGVPLAGTATVAPAAIGTLVEGVGELVLVPAGARRFFTFTLPERRRIGIGVRAGASAVEAELYGDDGELRSRGVVHIAELAAGRYFVALTQAPRRDAATPAPPVEASPVLIGLDTPGSGPPADVIRGYLHDSGVRTTGDEDQPSQESQENEVETNR